MESRLGSFNDALQPCCTRSPATQTSGSQPHPGILSSPQRGQVQGDGLFGGQLVEDPHRHVEIVAGVGSARSRRSSEEKKSSQWMRTTRRAPTASTVSAQYRRI